MSEELLNLYQLIVKRIELVTSQVIYTDVEEYRRQGALGELEELKELLDGMI